MSQSFLEINLIRERGLNPARDQKGMLAPFGNPI
jgi:hypothetical protein